MKYKVTCIVKPKRTQASECSTFEDLNNWISKIFSVQITKIQFVKPRIVVSSFLFQDEASFAKLVKEGTQITFKQIYNQTITNEQIKKMKQQLYGQDHQTIVEKLKQLKIQERDFCLYDKKNRRIIFMQFALYPLHLLKRVPKLVKQCQNFKCSEDGKGFLIQQLGKAFKQLDKGKQKSLLDFRELHKGEYVVYDDGVAHPLDWASAWFSQCTLEQKFKNKIFDLDYFLNATFQKLKSGFQTNQYKPEYDKTPTYDHVISQNFGIYVQTKRKNQIQPDQDDEDNHLQNKQVQREVVKYFLQCDLSRSDLTRLVTGIKQRFKKKILWEMEYGDDIKYSQEILSIQKLPKYLFIHANRFGYMPANQKWKQVDLSRNKKQCHQVRIQRVIDLNELCNKSLQNNFYKAGYQRNLIFEPYDMDPRFPQFKNSVKNKQHIGDNQLKYMYFDYILNKLNIFHEYNFQKNEAARPTGQYRLIGLILHKGQYFYNQFDTNKDCKGELMTMVYDRGTRWLRFMRGNVEVITIQEATDQKYWGKQGEWTPILFMYHQINLKYYPNLNLQSTKAKQSKSQKRKQQIQQLQKEQKQHKN